ncbi:MAG TPA: class I tRNA ligase family protein [Candidatus Nanopelagicales bacterium]|nr:class I tRNA ligase family protein [Candidatus Nanopelagicales bacterium]
MRIQRFDSEQLSRAYDIWCQSIQPWYGLEKPPFGASFALARPGEQTKRHAHQDGEAFFIMKGRGTIHAGEEIAEVRAGDVVYLPPFSEHTLENGSPDEELLFISIYWEDLAAWTARLAPAQGSRGQRAMVTAAPPTPNGDLHLGHLSGPYLAADIHARYLRARGVDAHYVSGTDDNQSYVATRAEQLGISPAETADRMADAIALTLKAARADLALFVRPNASPTHASMVQGFFRRLYDEGKLVEREADCSYCEGCERFLFEAHIRGRCPHCGAGAGGGSCEDCGRPNDCVDLVDPACTRCGKAPARRRATRIFFPLGEHAAALTDYHRTVSMPPHLRALCEQVIAAGLPDIAVAQPSDWGIPVPLASFEAQRFYAWFEMAPRYLAYAEELGASLGAPGGWARVWKDEEARVVQCFGFDNGFFYAVFVPALLRAYDPEIRLASAFLMNEFYRLDGLKFSTSRRHAIWGRELLARVTADQARFYLAYTCPEVEGTNFTLEEFAAVVDREIGGPIQAWLGELAARVAREASSAAPAPGDWTGEHRRFHGRLAELAGEAAAAYEAITFSPQRAARVISALVREARRFGTAEEHWTKVPGRQEERRTAIALELLAARVLCMLAAPIMPDFAVRLGQALGFHGGAPLGWEEHPAWVTPGQAIGDLGALGFPSARDALAAPARAAA